MCLSTVYKNTMEPASIAMKNVMSIECRPGQVILTDLLDRQLVIEGTLERANLVDGYVIVKESASLNRTSRQYTLPGRFLFWYGTVVAVTKSIVSLRTSAHTGVAIPYGGAQQFVSSIVLKSWRRLPRRVAPPPSSQ